MFHGSDFVYGSIAGVGSLFCIVTAQPWWISLLGPLIAISPSLYRLYQDGQRLKAAELRVTELERENAELQKRVKQD